MVLDSIPPFLPVVLAAAVAAVAPRKLGHGAGFLATAAVAVGSLFAPAGRHLEPALFGFETVLYQVDEFSRLMGVIFGLIGAAAVLYAHSSEADGRMTAAALGYVGTSLGAVFAGDWLTLVFFWELMAVTSTLLVWHYGGAAVRTGFRYAMAHGIGGSLVLGAVVWQYAAVGTFLFTGSGVAGPVAPALMAVGIGVNVGFIGLHTWLPDTYPSPHVAASVFLCVYTTKTGVYAMYRAFPEGHLWIAYMGGAMAVFGATMALLQEDMRRLLSYHILSQVGYMIAGVGIGTTLAAAGAFGHVFNHILYKALLFMSIGVVIYRTGVEDITEVGGLWRVMPVTFVSYLLGAAAIAGVPGFNGFVSKGIVIAEAHKSVENIVIGSESMPLGGEDLLWWLLIVGGVGTFMSFIKLGYYVFFHGPASVDPDDARPGQTVSMLTVGGLCLGLGLLPGVLFEVLPDTATIAAKYTTYTVGHVLEAAALGAAGFVGFFALKTPLSKATWIPDVDRLTSPLAFYGGRGLVVAVTETWAAVDRVAVAAADAATTVGANPRVYAYAAADRLPGVEAQPRTNGGRRLSLRASVGTSVFLIVTTLALALAVLVL